jgi:hypothetical protein
MKIYDSLNPTFSAAEALGVVTVSANAQGAPLDLAPATSNATRLPLVTVPKNLYQPDQKSYTITPTGVHTGDTVTINGRVFTATGSTADVGKIVFTNNFSVADTVTINGVVFTAIDGAYATGKIVFTGNFSLWDTITLNGKVFTAITTAAPAVGKLVFTGNLLAGNTVTVNGKVFTAVGIAAPAVGKIVFTGNFLNGDTVTFNGVTFTCHKAAPSVGSIAFTGNIAPGETVTANGIVFTCMASGAAGDQFNVGASLSVTLDNLVTALNAHVGAAVDFATWSKTGGNAAVTGTSDTNDATQNGRTFSSTASPAPTITAFANGVTAASGELQFDWDTTLSLSLDALVTKLQACSDVLISYATYTKTDTNTAVTSTSDTNNSAQNGLVFTSTHATVVVTAPVGGVSAPAGEFQFAIDTTLSLSIDNLNTALNGCTDVAVSYATYSKTDGNTAVTSTSDTNNKVHNGVAYPGGTIVLASNHSTVVITQPSGGTAAATGEFEFTIAGSLSLSLDALVIVCNACTDPLITYATYDKSDTNTSLRSIADTHGTAYNTPTVVFSSTHSTVVVTQPVGGVDDTDGSAAQFDVKATLALTLAALAAKLTASVVAAVAIADYTVTDGDTAITVTLNRLRGSAGDAIVLASNHSTVVVTQPTGGSDTTAYNTTTFCTGAPSDAETAANLNSAINTWKANAGAAFQLHDGKVAMTATNVASSGAAVTTFDLQVSTDGVNYIQHPEGSNPTLSLNQTPGETKTTPMYTAYPFVRAKCLTKTGTNAEAQAYIATAI